MACTFLPRRLPFWWCHPVDWFGSASQSVLCPGEGFIILRIGALFETIATSAPPLVNSASFSSLIGDLQAMSALMNCTRCEVCEAAVNVYAPLSFVHLSLLFRLLLEPICTLGAIVLTIAVYQTRALHFNARVLLVCMTASVAVSNIGEFY